MTPSEHTWLATSCIYQLLFRGEIFYSDLDCLWTRHGQQQRWLSYSWNILDPNIWETTLSLVYFIMSFLLLWKPLKSWKIKKAMELEKYNLQFTSFCIIKYYLNLLLVSFCLFFSSSLSFCMHLILLVLCRMLKLRCLYMFNKNKSFAQTWQDIPSPVVISRGTLTTANSKEIEIRTK